MWSSKHNDEFTDQVVLITGGSRGIGYATAQAFLEKKARIAICAQNPEKLAEAAEKLGQIGEVEAITADLRDVDQVRQFVNRAHERFKRIDILVNNAGYAWSGPFIEQSLDSLDKTIDVNVKGVLYAAQAVLPIMLEQKQGTVINVSSGAGLSGHPNMVSYCASKFAVVGFTESLAQEMDSQGVRIFGICPGRVATDMQVAVLGKKVGMSPDKVARKILQLAGNNPPVATGECLVVSS